MKEINIGTQIGTGLIGSANTAASFHKFDKEIKVPAKIIKNIPTTQ